MTRTAAIVINCTLAVFFCTGIMAGDQLTGLEIDRGEIPLTHSFLQGARTAALGSAYTALGEDYYALYYNPACLAVIPRIEIGGVISHRSGENRVTFFDSPEDSRLSKTHVNGLGAAIPIPTYRGGLVIGAGLFREFDFNALYLRTGTDPGLDPPLFETESERTEGSLYRYALGAGIALSPDLSFGLSFNIKHGTESLDWLYSLEDVYDEDPILEYMDIYEHTDVDLRGYSFTAGFLYIPDIPVVRLQVGCSLESPHKITFSGTSRLDTTTVYDNGDTESDGELYSVSDFVKLPFRFAVGGALRYRWLLFGAGARYTDWPQMTYSGEDYRSGEDDDYKTGIEYDLGIEVDLPYFPARLRGGVHLEPQVYRNVEGPSHRKIWIVGAGFLLEGALLVDISYSWSGLKTTQTRDYEEHRDFGHTAVSFMYRY